MAPLDPRTQQAVTLFQGGDASAAAGLLRAVVTERPTDLGATVFLAQVEAALGDPGRAAELIAAAERLAPDDPDLTVQRAAYLLMASREAEAVPVLEALLAARPGHAFALKFLLVALNALNRPAAAAAHADAVRRCAATLPDLHGLLAGPLLTIGRAAESFETQWAYCQARPDDADAALTLASTSNYVDTLNPDQIAQLHAWAGGLLERRGARGPADAAPAVPRRREAPARCRVGLLSADLRRHSAAYFVEPLLEHLDRERFELVVYSASPKRDEVTRRLEAYPAAWRWVADLDAAGLDAAIRADDLDVLVELSGLTVGQRLDGLVRRPARVQATYLGYPNTTGCRFIDARFVDSLTDPPGAEALHVERLERLESCFLCFKPGPETPAVRPRDPASPLTFGCFGAVSKYNESTLYAWARVLAAVPGSRLLLKARGLREERARDDVRQRLRMYGVAPDRVDIRGPLDDTTEHLAAYHDVDLALDTFPYHGTTTTCEAMLMGVPTVTRVGDRHAARVGLSLNSAVGLRDLCADDEGGYVAAAITLAQDRARLADLRATLRDRLLASPLGDGPGFGRRFGAALERVAGR